MNDKAPALPGSFFKKDACPYGPLYIYYFDGIVRDGISASDKTFLGNWEEDKASFLFFSRPAQETVDALLAHRPDLRLVDHFYLDYTHWQGTDLAPFQIGPLRVVPYWFHEDAPATPTDALRSLILDPGLVFGSGAHPTTLDCLKLLVSLLAEEPFHTVMDLGCGTGILAIAAVKLGCRRAVAVDLNPLAAATAQKNIRRNGMERNILAIQGDAKDIIDGPADLVIANIHYDALRHLLNAAGLNQKRWVLVSGLMRSDARTVVDALPARGFDVVASRNHEGIWFTYLAKNRLPSRNIKARIREAKGSMGEVASPGAAGFSLEPSDP